MAMWNYSVFTHLELLKMVTFMIVQKQVIIWGVKAAVGPAFMPNTDW